MNRAQLREKLSNMNTRPDAYSLDGGHPSEAYVLDQRGSKWRVYYSERGQETGAREFPNEEEACEYFLDLLSRDSSTRSS
jgi:hypothetical protein